MQRCTLETTGTEIHKPSVVAFQRARVVDNVEFALTESYRAELNTHSTYMHLHMYVHRVKRDDRLTE